MNDLLDRIDAVLRHSDYVLDIPIAILIAVVGYFLFVPNAWRRLNRKEFMFADIGETRQRFALGQKANIKKHYKPQEIVILCALWAILTVPMTGFFGVLGVGFAGFAAYYAMKLKRLVRRGKKADVDGQVLIYINVLSRALEQGQPIIRAIEQTSFAASEPLATQLQTMLRYGQGGRFDQAMEQLRQETDSVYLRRMLALLKRCYVAQNSPRAVALRMERFAEGLRATQTFRRKLKTSLSSANSQQTVISLLIPASFVLNLILNMSHMRFFWETNIGRILLLVLLTLWTSMRVIAARLTKVEVA